MARVVSDIAGNPFGVLSSGLRSMQRDQCATCHTRQRVGDSCLKCHNYHIGRIPKPGLPHPRL
jgi:hypothetical protein